MHSEIINRMAIAISGSATSTSIKKARAALNELRNPTLEMARAAGYLNVVQARNALGAMIDEVLKDE